MWDRATSPPSPFVDISTGLEALGNDDHPETPPGPVRDFKTDDTFIINALRDVLRAIA